MVWEETIILLPDNVHYVFLSATIPNAKQFAEWICHLHKQVCALVCLVEGSKESCDMPFCLGMLPQPCHVVYTEFRPVPLQHYIYPSGADGLYLVVDEKVRDLETVLYLNVE